MLRLSWNGEDVLPRSASSLALESVAAWVAFSSMLTPVRGVAMLTYDDV